MLFRSTSAVTRCIWPRCSHSAIHSRRSRQAAGGSSRVARAVGVFGASSSINRLSGFSHYASTLSPRSRLSPTSTSLDARQSGPPDFRRERVASEASRVRRCAARRLTPRSRCRNRNNVRNRTPSSVAFGDTYSLREKGGARLGSTHSARKISSIAQLSNCPTVSAPARGSRSVWPGLRR